MPGENYFLGLPAWAFPGWRDRYFMDRPSRLANYASVFNAVEGNTTFYGIPDRDTVRRWREAVDGTALRFCFKLPRDVTHERRPDGAALGHFLAAVEPLSDHLGPLLVQFPATVGPDELPAFEPVFAALDGKHRFVVEVRHPAFFEDRSILEPYLERYSAGRVVLDSRPLYEGDRTHPEVLSALHEKPDLPVVPTVFGDTAFVRLILHPDIDSNRTYLEEWVLHVAGYLEEGIETYMMIHCPNNLHCPALARDFHRRLMSQATSAELPELPAWPMPQQLSLV